ncbi:MAG: M56/M15 family metallopeptidase [Verrucomicrobiota bacterium]
MQVRTPPLYQSDEEKDTVPFVLGLFRPRIVLPALADTWSDAQLRSLFAHELAHIKRADLWARWVGLLLCAVQWFNPFVWWAVRRAELASELACDEAVLVEADIAPPQYAEHLLAIASQVSEPGRWVAVAMAKRGDLESRLEGILASRQRGGTSHGKMAFALAILLSFPIAMVAEDSSKPMARPTVILDPGHGGADAGGLSSSGIVEKERNLTLAAFLKKTLVAEGVEVVMTREKDRFLPLKQRVRKATEVKDGIFVSLHFNTHTDPKIQGGEIYVSQGGEAKSMVIGERIMANLLGHAGVKKRFVKENETFLLLRESLHPALLIEGGFLSSPAEAKRIGDDAYLRKMARAIADGLLDRRSPRSIEEKVERGGT